MKKIKVSHKYNSYGILELLQSRMNVLLGQLWIVDVLINTILSSGSSKFFHLFCDIRCQTYQTGFSPAPLFPVPQYSNFSKTVVTRIFYFTLIIARDQPFSAYAKFSEKLGFFTLWCALVPVSGGNKLTWRTFKSTKF